jgi:hypothetical protein
MSYCNNCYKASNIHFNFGNDREAENAYHKNYNCDCGYSSPEEMMRDQDLGFTDPRWVIIAKDFLNEYYILLRIRTIKSKDQHIRFFLKQLKYSINKYAGTIELVPNSQVEACEYANDGTTKIVTQANIFDDCGDLENLPTTVKLDITKSDLLKTDFTPKNPDDLNRIRIAYKQSQTKISELEKKIIIQNRWIFFCILLLITLCIIKLI